MTDHNLRQGDTFGDYTFTDLDCDIDGDHLTLTIEATGNPPAWLGAPVLKISRGDWRSFLLLNDLGGGYRAADGSLHTVAHIIDQARHNGYTVEAIS